jgi:hypothetical protein
MFRYSQRVGRYAAERCWRAGVLSGQDAQSGDIGVAELPPKLRYGPPKTPADAMVQRPPHLAATM